MEIISLTKKTNWLEVTHDTQSAQIPQDRNKMSVIYMYSQKDRKCTLPVITNPPMALW